MEEIDEKKDNFIINNSDNLNAKEDDDSDSENNDNNDYDVDKEKKISINKRDSEADSNNQARLSKLYSQRDSTTSNNFKRDSFQNSATKLSSSGKKSIIGVNERYSIKRFSNKKSFIEKNEVREVLIEKEKINENDDKEETNENNNEINEVNEADETEDIEEKNNIHHDLVSQNTQLSQEFKDSKINKVTNEAYIYYDTSKDSKDCEK